MGDSDATVLRDLGFDWEEEEAVRQNVENTVEAAAEDEHEKAIQALWQQLHAAEEALHKYLEENPEDSETYHPAKERILSQRIETVSKDIRRLQVAKQTRLKNEEEERRRNEEKARKLKEVKEEL